MVTDKIGTQSSRFAITGLLFFLVKFLELNGKSEDVTGNFDVGRREEGPNKNRGYKRIFQGKDAKGMQVS